MEYQIKGIKSFKGHEGEPCAQGNLYYGSQKVAEWSDDSCGGPLTVRFVSRQEESKFVLFAKDYLKTQKDYDGKFFDVSTMNDWSLVESAVNFMSYAAQEEKDLKKLCKGKIVFYAGTKSDKKLYTVKLPYTEDNVKKVKAANKDLLEVVNEKLNLPFENIMGKKLKP